MEWANWLSWQAVLNGAPHGREREVPEAIQWSCTAGASRSGASGWAVSPTNYTLQLTVGGIAKKPGYVDEEVGCREVEVESGAREVEPREYLSLTVTFDHDVVDGAPAARFVQRLGELIEGGHGLDGAAPELAREG